MNHRWWKAGVLCHIWYQGKSPGAQCENRPQDHQQKCKRFSEGVTGQTERPRECLKGKATAQLHRHVEVHIYYTAIYKHSQILDMNTKQQLVSRYHAPHDSSSISSLTTFRRPPFLCNDVVLRGPRSH